MPRERTNTTQITRQRLTASQDQFVQAWGQMGPSWGISRTMAEVHALLFIVGTPLNTDDVMERLKISRGNASMSLRSLVEWGIVSRVHKRGDRKEYFVGEQDVWSLARAIMRERLRREVLPTLATLYEIRDMTEDGKSRPLSHDRERPTLNPELSLEADHPLAEVVAGQAPTPGEVLEHNRRIDRMLELMQTIDRLGERFVGSEGKGLRVAATLLAKMV